jgi:hypothetical protein
VVIAGDFGCLARFRYVNILPSHNELQLAMAWMYNQYTGDSSGLCAGDNLKMAHSFASPVERPDLAARGTSQGPTAASTGDNCGSDSEDDNEKDNLQVAV